jgi:hypothetical protein
LIEVFVFDRAQHANADFCGGRDGFERYIAQLALPAKIVSKRSHGGLQRVYYKFHPHSDGTHHRRSRTVTPEYADSNI